MSSKSQRHSVQNTISTGAFERLKKNEGVLLKKIHQEDMRGMILLNINLQR